MSNSLMLWSVISTTWKEPTLCFWPTPPLFLDSCGPILQITCQVPSIPSANFCPFVHAQDQAWTHQQHPVPSGDRSLEEICRFWKQSQSYWGRKFGRPCEPLESLLPWVYQLFTQLKEAQLEEGLKGASEVLAHGTSPSCPGPRGVLLLSNPIMAWPRHSLHISAIAFQQVPLPEAPSSFQFIILLTQ